MVSRHGVPSAFNRCHQRKQHAETKRGLVRGHPPQALPASRPLVETMDPGCPCRGGLQQGPAKPRGFLSIRNPLKRLIPPARPSCTGEGSGQLVRTSGMPHRPAKPERCRPTCPRTELASSLAPAPAARGIAVPGLNQASDESSCLARSNEEDESTARQGSREAAFSVRDTSWALTTTSGGRVAAPAPPRRRADQTGRGAFGNQADRPAGLERQRFSR